MSQQRKPGGRKPKGGAAANPVVESVKEAAIDAVKRISGKVSGMLQAAVTPSQETPDAAAAVDTRQPEPSYQPDSPAVGGTLSESKLSAWLKQFKASVQQQPLLACGVVILLLLLLLQPAHRRATAALQASQRAQHAVAQLQSIMDSMTAAAGMASNTQQGQLQQALQALDLQAGLGKEHSLALSVLEDKVNTLARVLNSTQEAATGAQVQQQNAGHTVSRMQHVLDQLQKDVSSLQQHISSIQAPATDAPSDRRPQTCPTDIPTAPPPPPPPAITVRLQAHSLSAADSTAIRQLHILLHTLLRRQLRTPPVLPTARLLYAQTAATAQVASWSQTPQHSCLLPLLHPAGPEGAVPSVTLQVLQPDARIASVWISTSPAVSPGNIAGSHHSTSAGQTHALASSQQAVVEATAHVEVQLAAPSGHSIKPATDSWLPAGRVQVNLTFPGSMPTGTRMTAKLALPMELSAHAVKMVRVSFSGGASYGQMPAVLCAPAIELHAADA